MTVFFIFSLVVSDSLKYEIIVFAFDSSEVILSLIYNLDNLSHPEPEIQTTGELRGEVKMLRNNNVPLEYLFICKEGKGKFVLT